MPDPGGQKANFVLDIGCFNYQNAVPPTDWPEGSRHLCMHHACQPCGLVKPEAKSAKYGGVKLVNVIV